jgi:Xaa-Pro aminopeptidase
MRGLMDKITQIEFSKRRANLKNYINKGAMIIPGNISYIRNHDVHFDFRQNSDFWYLTGFDEPNAVIVMLFKPEIEYILFVEPYDVHHHIWEGYRAGIDGAITDFKADKAYPISELNNILPELISEFDNIYYRVGSDSNIDDIITSFYSIQLRQVTGKRGNYNINKNTNHGAISIIDPIPFVSELRMIKSNNEIKLIDDAINISKQGFNYIHSIIDQTMTEYQVQTELEYIFRKNGSRYNAYPSIVAGGNNACVLHYIDNNQNLSDADFILIDAGAELDYYASDITRTYRVSSKVNALQTEAYNIVFEAQQTAINAVKPGVTLKDIHKAALDVLVSGLKSLKLLSGSNEEIISNNLYAEYYMHGTSHWLGLDVHDSSPYSINKMDIKLKPGMIFTVEPGLYFSERSDYTDFNKPLLGTGIRIEDDVLVTETGFRNMSKEIIY